MTRIALCYSGRPRSFSETFQNHQEVFGLGEDNVDVFAHLWFDDDLQTKPYKYGGNSDWEHQRIKGTAIDEFVRAYNPVSYTHLTLPTKRIV